MLNEKQINIVAKSSHGQLCFPKLVLLVYRMATNTCTETDNCGVEIVVLRGERKEAAVSELCVGDNREDT